MTQAAIRPHLEASKGRDVSLLSDAHASRSVSALSVALCALYGSLAPKKYAASFFVVVGVEPHLHDADERSGLSALDLTKEHARVLRRGLGGE